MLKSYILLLLPLLLGWLLSKIKFVPGSLASALNFFVINIALPATVIISIRGIELSYDLLIPVGAQWVSLTLSALLVIVASRLFSFSRLVAGTLLLVVPLGNTAFLGLSILPILLGNSALPYGVIYDQLGSFLALATYGAAIAAVYGVSNGINAKSLITKVIFFPPFIFLVLGLVFRDLAIPEPIHEALWWLSRGLVPAAMIAIGMNVSFRIDRHLIQPLLAALVVRLLLIPVTLLIAFFVAGLTGMAAQVAVIQAAMPSMITAAVLATDKGLDKRLATAIVSIGLIISLATLPLMYLFIKLLLVPIN